MDVPMPGAVTMVAERRVTMGWEARGERRQPARLGGPAALLLIALSLAFGCGTDADAGGSGATNANANANANAGDVMADAGRRPDDASGEDAAPAGSHIAAITPPEGPTAGMQLVEISGAGLATATAVYFGDSKGLDLEVVGAELLRVRTPPQPPGDVDVRVLRATDKGIPEPELLLAPGYRYLATVRVDAVEPASGPRQGGTLVTVRGAGFVPGTQFVFGRRLAISPQIVDEFSATMQLPPGEVGAVAVVAANGDGQGSLSDGFTYLDAPFPPAVADVKLLSVQPQRLAPAGGSALTLQFSAPSLLGKVVGIQVGPLHASGLAGAASSGASSDGTSTVTATAPPGSPGPAAITLFFASGAAVFPDAVLYASDKPTLAAVLPGRGAQAGGTVVDLVGDGMDRLYRVRFAGKDGVGVVAVDAGLARVSTPPAETPGPVHVVAHFGTVQQPQGQNLRKNAYVYFDPAQQSLGTWGPPIAGALNVTVMRADWPWGIVANALVVIGDGKDATLRGMTDARGQVTLSKPGLVGPLDVSASRDGYGAATIAGTQSENATLLIRKYPEPGPGEPFEWPKTFFSAGTIEGKVVNHAKYAGLPRGRCHASAGAGTTCAPCGGPASCDAGLQCLGADAELWPPTPATATASGLCLQPCAMPTDCPSGLECRLVNSAPAALPGPVTATDAPAAASAYACIPPIGEAQTRCETTLPRMFALAVDPGAGAIAKDDGSFVLKTRLGLVAVACRSGYIRSDTGAFVPLWLGVARSVEVPDDDHAVTVQISLDSRLGRSLPVRLEGLPLGPDSDGLRRRLDAWLDFGGEGVLPMGTVQTTARTQTFVVGQLPWQAGPSIAGLSYLVYGGIDTPAGLGMSPLALGHANHQTPSDVEGFARWLDGEPAPALVAGGAHPAQAVATGAIGTVAVGPGGKILHWGGGSFTPQPQPTEVDLHAVALDPAAADGWIGGDAGVLLRRDATAGWRPSPSPTAAAILGLVWLGSGGDALLLADDGTLFRHVAGSWEAAPAGPWLDTVSSNSQAAPPTSLRQLGDGTVVVTTRAGAVYHAVIPAVAAPWTWQTLREGGAVPLHAAGGASAQELWAVGARGTLLRRSQGAWTALPTGTLAGLYGLRVGGGGVDAVGDNATWLRVGEGASAVTAWPLPGLSADLRAVIDVAGGPVALGTPVLALQRWLEMPALVQPAADGPLPLHLQWTWPAGGAAASLQWLQISTYWELPYWDVVAAADRSDVVLPDFPAIGGWQPLPTGPLRLKVQRIYAPGLSIGHFAHEQLYWMSWTSWAAREVLTHVFAGDPFVP